MNDNGVVCGLLQIGNVIQGVAFSQSIQVSEPANERYYTLDREERTGDYKEVS